jgi:hypothetical protein
MNSKNFLLILVSLHTEAAWANVDPGSGMLMIQGMIALTAFAWLDVSVT